VRRSERSRGHDCVVTDHARGCDTLRAQVLVVRCARLGVAIETLAARRSRHSSLGAVKHSIIVACWHMLTTGEIYHRPDAIARRLSADSLNFAALNAHQRAARSH
jgi:hypothetical protein